LKAVVDKLTPPSSPILLAGDFNDWQEKLHKPIQDNLHVREAFVTLTGELMPSSPSMFPIFSLDRIYYRKIKPLAAQSLVTGPWHLRSDHLPMAVEFEI